MQSSTSAGRSATAQHQRFGAPPTYYFSAHTSCCETEGGAVILDLNSDTYLGIDAQHLSNLRERIGNWPESNRRSRKDECQNASSSEDLIADLLARGVLTATPAFRRGSVVTKPENAWTLESFARVHRNIPIKHIVSFFAAFVTVAWHLKRNKLPSLLDWIRERQSGNHRGRRITQESALRRLESFLWLRTWCYTARHRCLFDSLVLTVYLTKGMVSCVLVIGVTSKPFLAHSWVQIGESVLNDTAEHVQTFEIILSVGGE